MGSATVQSGGDAFDEQRADEAFGLPVRLKTRGSGEAWADPEFEGDVI